MRLTRISAPTGLPVSVVDARGFCRVSHVDEDSLIEGLIGAAHDLLDGPTGLLGRAILTQTWRMELTAWPQSVVLPIEPVSAVSVSWLDAANAAHDLDDAATVLVANPGAAPVLTFDQAFSLPSLSATAAYPVRIDMTCGYGGASAVPGSLRQAILMTVAHWYANREAAAAVMVEVPLAVSALLARHRRWLG